MALAQHLDDQLRYNQQVENSRNFVLPFINEKFPVHPGMHIMEIGCGEGGVLVPFLELGCPCVGVDLQPARIALAKNFLAPYVKEDRVQLIAKNIYDVDFYGAFQHAFDLIILKDAIEHIPDQEKLIGYLKGLLKPGGQIFFGFPPWYMPHGGHQQICESKILSFWPYIHLLPRGIYRGILRLFKEHDSTVKELMEVKDTGISIERFEKIIKRQSYQITHKRFYLINPIYKYKFNLKPRTQAAWMAALPYVRDFFTTCVYYLIQVEK